MDGGLRTEPSLQRLPSERCSRNEPLRLPDDFTRPQEVNMTYMGISLEMGCKRRISEDEEKIGGLRRPLEGHKVRSTRSLFPYRTPQPLHVPQSILVKKEQRSYIISGRIKKVGRSEEERSWSRVGFAQDLEIQRDPTRSNARRMTETETIGKCGTLPCEYNMQTSAVGRLMKMSQNERRGY